jgi:hypothetical protein
MNKYGSLIQNFNKLLDIFHCAYNNLHALRHGRRIGNRDNGYPHHLPNMRIASPNQLPPGLCKSLGARTLPHPLKANQPPSIPNFPLMQGKRSHIFINKVKIIMLIKWSYKVDEASSISFLNRTFVFWLLISSTVALIWRVSDTWWFNYHLDDIWVSHLCKSQTTPTILHNEDAIHQARYA